MLSAFLAARTVLTLLPALGYLGLAVHQAVNQHDLSSASQSLASAAGIAGVGGYLHSIQSSVNPPVPPAS